MVGIYKKSTNKFTFFSKIILILAFLAPLVTPQTSDAQIKRRSRKDYSAAIQEIKLGTEPGDVDQIVVVVFGNELTTKTLNICRQQRCVTKDGKKLRGTVLPEDNDAFFKAPGAEIVFSARPSRKSPGEYDAKHMFFRHIATGEVSKCRIRPNRTSISISEKVINSRRPNRIRIRISDRDDSNIRLNIDDPSKCVPGASVILNNKNGRISKRKYVPTESTIIFGTTPVTTPTPAQTPNTDVTPTISISPTPQPPVATPTMSISPTPVATATMVPPVATPTQAPMATPTPMPTIAPTNTPAPTPTSAPQPTATPTENKKIVAAVAILKADNCQGSNASGTSLMKFEDDKNTIEIGINVVNLEGRWGASHVHTVSDGSIWFGDIPLPSDPAAKNHIVNVAWKFSSAAEYEDMKKKILNKEAYLNVHTSKCPSGEVSGVYEESDVVNINTMVDNNSNKTVSKKTPTKNNKNKKDAPVGY